jgi:5-methylcytosine-specific restriction endonuclease McrA
MAIRKQVVRDQPFCRDGRACGHRAMSAEVDHIKPLCFGGHPTERANLQGICHACHVEKTREEQKLFQQMQGD